MPMLFAFALAAAAPAAAAPAGDESQFRLVNPRAIELFEADGRLMAWALRNFDANGDRHLSIFESDAAAREFKRIADGDRDGRVTPAEYRSARDFVVARWGASEAQAASR